MNLERQERSGAGMAAGHGISCTRCGAFLKPGKKFCSQCGCPTGGAASSSPVKPVRRPKICPECSFENHHSDLFCKGCGAELAGLPAAAASRNFTEQVAITPPRLERLVKTETEEPRVSSQEPPDLATDTGNTLFMPVSIVAPPLEEAAKADTIAPLVTATEPGISDEWRAPIDEQRESQSPEISAASHAPTQDELREAASILRPSRREPRVLIPQPRHSETDAAPVLIMPPVTPSMVSSGEVRAPLISVGHLIAKLRGAIAPVLGAAALGVGLAAVIALVHFRQPAKAQAKQVPMAATAAATLPASPSLPEPEARTNPADQRLRSVNLASEGVRRGSRSGRPPAPLTVRQKSLENTNRGSAKGDVPELTPSGSGAPALAAASSPPESQTPSRLGPAPIPVHPETEQGVPLATSSVASQAPAPPVEVSRQIPAAPAPISNVPANLPAETNQSPDSPAAPAATKAAEGAPVVLPAKLLSRPALQYPVFALEARVQGDVRLEANVRADGTVASVRVVKGVVMLNDAAVDLVQNSRYQPALVDGHPVRSNVEVVISFRLPR